MRHRVGHRKLGRVTEHRIALLRNQAEALLTHEHITTTVPKAKELRPFVEKLITTAKRGVRAADPKGVTLSARRLVMRHVVDQDVVGQAVRSAGAALHGAAGRLHPHPQARLPARRRGRDGPDRAGRVASSIRRRPRPRRRRRPKPATSRSRRRASASGCAAPPRASAARRRTRARRRARGRSRHAGRRSRRRHARLAVPKPLRRNQHHTARAPQASGPSSFAPPS